MTPYLVKLGRTLFITLFVCGVVCVGPVSAGPGEDAVREVGRLMQESRWQEALDVAREAPVREGTRASLIGLISMRRGAYAEAIEAFEEALRLGPERETIYLYLAWSHYSLGAQDEATEALARVKSKDARGALYWLLSGRIARDSKRPSKAYEVLLRGHRLFPEERSIARELGLLLVEFGALRHARSILLPVLTNATVSYDESWADATRLLQVLTAREQEDEAMFYTALMRARWPEDGARLDALDAHLHARAGRPRSAARAFERATLRGATSYAFEAADQYRVARQSDAALRWNGKVSDRQKRLSQRFLILTEAGRWSRAAVTARQLQRLGALDTPRLRYRYGVALLLGVGDVEGARRQLDTLDGALSSQLQQLITRCEDNPESCL